ncbi:PREDICTED: uncharacterized protein At1g43920, Chloroplastic-like [Camelina sativa]|uniref:Uncharacterized protein At1g43920, Chloroplastic-like n=1 Tax=Camelina sativa TaxID=90675 RepID=A0ABM0TDC4_CAMSA|nr:PREDICTED: uncharacterized protein At1g43920, Chloroplastic-like [Camelina sativa]
MSCNFGQSSCENRGRGSHGFPAKCHYGLDVAIYTSSTKQNPGRPYFRCPTRGDEHLFKWVEEGVYEELVEALPKISIINNEISNARYEVAVEIDGLKTRIEELKEDAMCSKRELKKWKLMILCLVCLCVTVIVIVILMCKTSKGTFVLGY